MKVASRYWKICSAMVLLVALKGCTPTSEPKAVVPPTPEVSVETPPTPPEPIVTPPPAVEPVAPPPLTPEERLRLGADTWNAWRTEEGGPLPELRALDFSGLSLGAVNFAEMTLVDCNFEGAVLSGADFQGATLTDCHFEGAHLDGARFEGARGQGLVFVGADLSQCHLGFAALADVNLSNATVHQIEGWERINSVSGLNIYRVVKAPAAFKAWALENGAVKRAPHEGGPGDGGA